MQTKKSILLLLSVLLISIGISGCGEGSGDSAGGGSILNNGLSSGSISLAWDNPTTNIDGSSLADLAGYKVYYGPNSENYTLSINIGNLTEATISDLSAGKWCFAISAYDYSGNESSLSNEVCTMI